MQTYIKELEEQFGKPISEFSILDWWKISYFPKLSEDFIRKFQDNVCWYFISVRQVLSEDFIREFQDKVVWTCISQYQELSEDFIKEFQDKLE